MRRRSGSGSDDAIYYAGWLFADLMLAAAIIFLVAIPATEAAPPTATPTGTPTVVTHAAAESTLTQTPMPTMTRTPTFTSTPTPTPTPSVTPTPTTVCLPRVIPRRVVFDVPGEGPGVASEARIRSTLGPLLPTGAVAGIVYSYGHAEKPEVGKRYATEFNQRVQLVFPAVFLPEGQTIYQALRFENTNRASAGDVNLDVYFLETSCR